MTEEWEKEYEDYLESELYGWDDDEEDEEEE